MAWSSASIGSGPSLGVCRTHSPSSNELVSFFSSELTRVARSEWQRARNSSCDAAGWCAPKGTVHSSMKSAMMSAMIEDLLARGGHGDLRYTLDSRLDTSLSNSSCSNRPTRSLEGVVLEWSCSSSPQRSDGAFGSGSVGMGALSEELLKPGGQGDCGSNFDLRPVTSLSDSNRPTRWQGGFVLERSCSWQQRGDEEQRRRRAELPRERDGREWLGVPVMAFGEMIWKSRFGTTQILRNTWPQPPSRPTWEKCFRCCHRCLACDWGQGHC